MSETRVIPQADSPETRVETGPLRFGDDWTGVFIRGDNAVFFAYSIRSALSRVVFSAGDRMNLTQLAELLESADERKNPRD